MTNEQLEIINKYMKWVEEVNYSTLSRTKFLKASKISRRKFENSFPNWNMFQKIVKGSPYNLKEKRKNKMIEYAQKLYKKHGRLTSRIMKAEGFPESVTSKYFDSFIDLLIDAELPVEKSQLSQLFTLEDYYENLYSLENKYGYVNATLINEKSYFTSETYISKFKTLGQACIKAKVRHLGQLSINTPNSLAMQAINKTSFYLKDTYFHTEITFDWLRSKRTDIPLPVDAYFPYHNLMIEFHGPQHYEKDHYFNLIQLKERGRARSPEEDKHKKQTILNKGYNYIEIYDYELNDLDNVLNTRIKQLRL